MFLSTRSVIWTLKCLFFKNSKKSKKKAEEGIAWKGLTWEGSSAGAAGSPLPTNQLFFSFCLIQEKYLSQIEIKIYKNLVLALFYFFF
jgi:hypothetical protein